MLVALALPILSACGSSTGESVMYQSYDTSNVVAWAGDGWVYFVKDYAGSDQLPTELWRIKPGGKPQQVGFPKPWSDCTVDGMGALPDGALGLQMDGCGQDSPDYIFARMDTSTGAVTVLNAPASASEVAWNPGLRSGVMNFDVPGCGSIDRFAGTARTVVLADAAFHPAMDRQGNAYYFQAEDVQAASDCEALIDRSAWRLVRVSPRGSATTLLTVTQPQALTVGHDGTVAFGATVDGTAGMWALRPGHAGPQRLGTGMFVSVAISPTNSDVVGLRQDDAALVLVRLD